MIEFSITEIVLIVWAGIATALYFHERHQAHMARFVFQHFIENPEAREDMLKRWEQSQREGA